MSIVNTSTSIKKASTALKDRIEATKKNMKKLMTDAGCTEYKTVRTMIPRIPGSDDDVVFVGLNGQKFYFQRGTSSDIPEPVLFILQDCGVV